MKIIKVLQKTFMVLLIIIFLLMVIPTTYVSFARIATKKLQPTIFGYASAVVISGSMSGTIEIDDYIITKKQNEYKVNDIIMFISESGKSLVTHRIVAITEDGIQTKGDANNAPDTYIMQTDKIVGKVVKIIPKIGRVFTFLNSYWGILCVFTLGILVIEGPNIIKKLKKEKQEKKA